MQTVGNEYCKMLSVFALLMIFLPLVTTSCSGGAQRCEWVPWQPWGDCSSSCGGGYRHRSRSACCATGWSFDECVNNCPAITHEGARDSTCCNEVCLNEGNYSAYYESSCFGFCDCQEGFHGSCCQNLVDCGDPGSISNGNVSISNTTFGGTVTYTCNQFYNLTGGDTVRTCQKRFTWSGTEPRCAFVNSCESNPCHNGGTCVDGLDIFTCQCLPGWSGVQCEEDVQAPELANCSLGLNVTATIPEIDVAWQPPTFWDPFNNTVDIVTNYPDHNFSFPWGDFSAQYVATKLSNGMKTECTFPIKVRPTPCSKLDAPRNGSVVCSSWKTDFGRICMIFCQSNYLLDPGHSYGTMYLCGASGRWSPGQELPDCNLPLSAVKSPEKYHTYYQYYAYGNCSDDADQNELKAKFIDSLRNSNLASFCIDYKNLCHDVNVDIDCYK